MGKPWHEQELTGSVLDVLEDVRDTIREGDFDLKTWDHNSPHYVDGRSNKRIKIAGARLLDLDSRSAPTYEQCKQAVLEAILGRNFR